MLSFWARLFSPRDEKKIAEAIFYACVYDDEGSDDEAHSANEVLDGVPEANYPNYARAIFTFIQQTYRSDVDDLRVVLDEVLDSGTPLGKIFQSTLQAEKLLAEVRACRDALPPIQTPTSASSGDDAALSSSATEAPCNQTEKKPKFKRAVEPPLSSDDEAASAPAQARPSRKFRKKRPSPDADAPRHHHTPGGRPSA